MKTSKTLSFVLVILTLVVFCPKQVQAETSYMGYANALLGVGIVNNSGGTNATYGVGGGYFFDKNWSAGADFTYNSFTVPAPLSANMWLILANVKYYYKDTGFFGGLKLGFASFSYSGTGAPASSSNFAWGPTIGYNYFLDNQWSVGGEANLLWVSTTPSVSDLQILATGKYWF